MRDAHIALTLNNGERVSIAVDSDGVRQLTHRDDGDVAKGVIDLICALAVFANRFERQTGRRAIVGRSEEGGVHVSKLINPSGPPWSKR